MLNGKDAAHGAMEAQGRIAVDEEAFSWALGAMPMRGFFDGLCGAARAAADPRVHAWLWWRDTPSAAARAERW
ncbi:MAG TPA: hypothetical protein VF727_04825 [Allosphingosinicella sp.]